MILCQQEAMLALLLYCRMKRAAASMLHAGVVVLCRADTRREPYAAMLMPARSRHIRAQVTLDKRRDIYDESRSGCYDNMSSVMRARFAAT